MQMSLIKGAWITLAILCGVGIVSGCETETQATAGPTQPPDVQKVLATKVGDSTVGAFLKQASQQYFDGTTNNSDSNAGTFQVVHFPQTDVVLYYYGFSNYGQNAAIAFGIKDGKVVPEDQTSYDLLNGDEAHAFIDMVSNASALNKEGDSDVTPIQPTMFPTTALSSTFNTGSLTAQEESAISHAEQSAVDVSHVSATESAHASTSDASAAHASGGAK